MKKQLLAVILVLAVCATLMVACAPKTPNEDTTPFDVSVFVPDGAPAMAVANIIDSGKIGEHKATVTLASGERVIEKLGKEEADVAVVPTNAAVKICSTGGKYQLFTVNVYGLMYVIGYENVTSLSQLAGKKVLSIGKANTGEYLFKALLNKAGVALEGEGAVDISYYADGSEAGQLLLAGQGDFALLGEPAATNFINKAATQGKTLYRVFDLQQLWKTATEADSVGYPQASVVVKKELLADKDFVSALYQTLTANEQFLQENVARLKDILVGAGSSIQANYTADIIARCNLRVVKANTQKQVISTYLSEFGAAFANMLNDEIYYEF